MAAMIPQTSLPPGGTQTQARITPRELAILLSRLKQSILHPTQQDERRLRTSHYERVRVESNLNFARSALKQLELSSLSSLSSSSAAAASWSTSKRAESPVDLHAQREVLELLYDRLEDYNKLAADYEGDDSSDEEDLLAAIIPTPSESQDSRRSSHVGRDDPDHMIDETLTPQAKDHVPESEPKTTPESQHPSTTTTTATATTTTIPTTAPIPTTTETTFPSPAAPATQTSNDLRPRGPGPSPSPFSSSPPQPTAHSTARAALFASRVAGAASPTTATTAATAEAILDQQRGEQEAILESIRKMAGALKHSSQKFSASLESDKGRLDAAGTSMEKSGLSMEAAQGRMGSLRRMTEGEGWWGRMMLYAWIYGLMIMLLVVVFVLPKLRF